MYNTILVPLDGSGRAEAILPHVEELAHRYQAKVIFLQIVEPAVIVGGPHEFYVEPYLDEMKRREDEAKSYLTCWQGEFREKGVEANICVENGSIVETIINVAKRESADLVAMASHGRSGLSHVFYGSGRAPSYRPALVTGSVVSANNQFGPGSVLEIGNQASDLLVG